MVQHANRRFSSGIDALDQILEGGLPHPSSYLAVGGVGTGKTVMASQIAFSLASRGVNSCFVSILTEPVSSLLRNLEPFPFVDPGQVGKRIHFISAIALLEEEGLEGFEKMLRQIVQKTHSSLVVLDNISALGSFAPSERVYRAFLLKLISLCSMAGATLLATSDRRSPFEAVEESVFDGVVVLQQSPKFMRRLRTIEVLKSRGAPHLPGKHAFSIGPEGVRIWPRIEGLYRRFSRYEPGRRRLSLRIPSLDEMFCGGLVEGSATAVFGAAGTGKTLFGSSYLAAGLANGERGLYVGFQEPPAWVIAAGEGIGLPLREGVEAGNLLFEWRQTGEGILDEFGASILRIVDAAKPKRLVIDSVGGLALAYPYAERIVPFLYTLLNQLRARGITVILLEGKSGWSADLSIDPIARNVENVLLFKYDRVGDQLRRVLRIAKSRGSDFDATLREYWISSHGFTIAPATEGPIPPGAYWEEAPEGSEGHP